MKRFLAVLVFCMGTASFASAASFFEIPIVSTGGATTVDVSTFAWTRVIPSTGVSSGRVGIFVNNAAANDAAMCCTFSMAATVATVEDGVTTCPLEIGVGEDKYYPFGDAVFLYCRSLNGAATTDVLSVKQARQYNPSR